LETPLLAKHNIESIKVAMTPTAMVVYCSVLIQGFAHIAGYDPSSVELNSALGVKGHSQEPTQQNIELRMASAIQLRKSKGQKHHSNQGDGCNQPTEILTKLTTVRLYVRRFCHEHALMQALYAFIVMSKRIRKDTLQLRNERDLSSKQSRKFKNQLPETCKNIGLRTFFFKWLSYFSQ
jgi:hypothetical protein